MEGEEFGQKPPPLSVTINKILDRYPDGQIFKEMIQNADDAGATMIQFFVDHRQHTPSSTPSPGMENVSKLLGPALLSANNATFTEDDWEGIRNLHQSIKADDPFKVGRFGIGFNSVYHITDVAAIISMERLAYLDPQESLWTNQSGRAFTLSKILSSDYLVPFNGIADFDATETQCYTKTLFRFPLRSNKSALSDNVYTVEKLLKLIDALKSEADFLLLFLRSITSIEVYEIVCDGQSPNLLFKTSVSEKYIKDLTDKRTVLAEKVKNSHDKYGYSNTEVHSFNARFEVNIVDCEDEKKTAQWIVSNQVGSSVLAVQEASKKQKVFPWVGAALKLNNMDKDSRGRVFCFLPMPPELSSDLPVHINGTFGVSDDRRSLKWPGLERQNDSTANWNMILVNEVLPACYGNLLIAARDHVTNVQFYTYWPDIGSLQHTQWRGILKPLFDFLLNKEVIWCMTTRHWQLPRNVYYLPQLQIEEAIVKILTSTEVKIAKIPKHIQEALEFCSFHVNEIKPSIVREKMRQNVSSYCVFQSSWKFEVIKYCWSDKIYSDFNQLELVPLANGDFTKFKGCHGYTRPSQIYLCSNNVPKYLLPNLEHKLIDLCDDSELNTGFKNIVQSNTTQLKQLEVGDVAKLIDEGMPPFADTNDWFHWFKQFWEWMHSKSLSLFSNKLLMLVQSCSKTSVVRLHSDQAAIYIPINQEVSSEMLALFDKFGVSYTLQKKFPYLFHSQLKEYFNIFHVSSILKAMSRNRDCKSIELSKMESKLLLDFIASEKSLTWSDLAILKCIKMFTSSTNTKGKLYSVNEVLQQSLLRECVIEPLNFFDLSNKLPNSIILFSASDYCQNLLLQKLSIPQCTIVEFLEKYIFPKIASSCIEDSFIDNIMTYVLEEFHNLSRNSSTLKEKIKNLKFVKAACHNRKAPSELYNRKNSLIAQILHGQSVFPSEPFCNSQYVSVLKECGLRDCLSPQEIVESVISIGERALEKPQLVNTEKYLRAKAVLAYIQTPDMKKRRKELCVLHRSRIPFDQALLVLSQERSWLPVLPTAPASYPSCLQWKGNTYTSHFVSLSNKICVSCNSKDNFMVYGSQCFFTEPSVDSDIYEWLVNPEPIDCLGSHLSEVISAKNQMKLESILHIVSKIYHTMQRILDSDKGNKIDSIINIKEWIFIMKENKFVDIESVAMHENPKFRHSIEPYLYILPDSISRYSDIFLHFGMNKTVTETQIISILETIKDQITHTCFATTAADMWDTIMAILNWVTCNATQEISFKSILVPIESSLALPNLQMSDTMVYTDNEFLKDFVMGSSDISSGLQFTHSRISPNLARCLKVTPLSEELDISEDTFSDAGQHEPLIIRLKNILNDYKDGVTIIKELIQNADDAEATEMTICYDARDLNTDKKRSFFPGMSDTHGPALIVHNNKTFTDEDFENIQKLAAGTKAKKNLKIGKFGIGFCSVYHITDVPSFISRNRLYIFDPTLNYLKKEIKNSSQPGKKVNFLARVIQNSKQLAPYEGLYGFDSSKEYEGTFFRFPFRKSHSELGNPYTESHVKDIFDQIIKNGDELLLFLQKINTITIEQIKDGETLPNEIFKITRKKQALPLNIDQLHLAHEVVIQKTLHQSTVCKSTNWLVATATSKASNNEDMVASVSCLLEKNTQNGQYNLNVNLKGDTFCYLPLLQSTGLPVHISCNFAVLNNRRGIWTTADALSDEKEVQWNISLMKGVIPEAYINLLCCLREMLKRQLLVNYKFYSIWPLEKHLDIKNPWNNFVASLYKVMCDKDLFYSDSIACWTNRSKCKFLLDNILCSTTPLECVVQVVCYLNEPIAQLPLDYRLNFTTRLADIGEEKFVHLFFKNLNTFFNEEIRTHRDQVIYQMLKIYASPSGTTTSKIISVLKNYFSTTASVPCGPNGMTLHKCGNSIHPRASFADLFDESECHFPISLLINDRVTCEALKAMGMIHDNLPWSLLLNRAQTICDIYKKDQHKALKRVKLILQSLFHSHEAGKKPNDDRLETINFLPVMKKPNDFPVHWAGDGLTLCCAREIILQGVYSAVYNPMICGSQIAFVNESDPKDGGCGYVNPKVKDFLRLKTSPKLSAVVDHLKVIVSQYSDDMDKKWISTASKMIYDFIETALQKSDPHKCLTELAISQCLWNEHKFLEAKFIAKNWRFQNGPYLYSIPEVIIGKKQLIKLLNIKENFSLEDAIYALEKMKEDFGSNPINLGCHQLITDLFSTSLVLDPSLMQGFKVTHIYLPSEQLVMFRSNELAYNDAVWAPKDENYIYVHEDIPRRIAEALGVRLVRSKLLDSFVSENVYFSGSKFGQREELTQRIQNILRDYPFDITLLKELLQNSDDAKAKQMYIILDKRHHGKESLISQNWQKLQGPALLVWNDSTFSEKDLKGIQELGLGSKRLESETIGQYGIGFNVVYHLTDCPSFITGGETLCIMDPHCMYADGATPLSPGRRYNNITKNGFWNHFKDMSTSYLVTGIENIPLEMNNGSLFRFPIRYSKEMVESSKVIDRNYKSNLIPMTVNRMAELLRQWMPNVKDAMFFLNNVDEIKYMEIEPDDTKLSTIFHYSCRIPESKVLEKSIEDLKHSISNLKVVSSFSPTVACYPIVITTLDNGTKSEEMWMIQQGVGDKRNSKQMWQYVDTVKPRHGIAAPLDMPHKAYNQKKQVFCFLPLPIYTTLPVHINASFILNSNRRDLWKPTTSNEMDNKSRWNNNLFQAIASSYAEFLSNVKNFYLKLQYSNWTTAVNDLNKYCNIFPSSEIYAISDIKEFVDIVFEILVQENSKILCVFLSKQKHSSDMIVPQWHPIVATDNEKQVYFWSGSENRKLIYPILENLGMTITSMSRNLREVFNNYLQKMSKHKPSKQIPAISPTTVFEYYTSTSCYSSARGMKCIPISQTIFHDVETFSIFLKFLLRLPLLQSNATQNDSSTGNVLHVQQSQVTAESVTYRDFPLSPYSHYLLLSVDNSLQKFDENSKLFNSEFSDMFPKFKNRFLHPTLRKLEMNPTYFVCECENPCNSEYTTSRVIEIFKSTLPRELSSNAVISNASDIINKQCLVKFWEVLCNDRVFKSYVPSIIKQVSLLLTENDILYSTSSKILPMYHPPTGEESTTLKKLVEVLNKLELPFLDESVVLVPVNCPHLKEDAHMILSNIVQVSEKLSSILGLSEIKILIDYFAENLDISEHFNELKRLPLFENVLGTYQSIEKLDAYIWPNTCSDGYNSWIKGYDGVVFLKSDGYWSKLGSEAKSSLKTISKEKIYNDFIFKHPHFGLMTEEERFKHLEYIKDELFFLVEHHKAKRTEKTMSADDKLSIIEAQDFYDGLVQLQCIGATNTPLHPISSFCDHTKDIFRAFPDDFKILPNHFNSEIWLDFFKKINLKQNLAEHEYVELCQKTANGNVYDMRKVSSTLLKYLKDAGSSYSDYTLKRIANIAFVLAEKPLEVDWIVPGVAQVNQVVKLNGSAPLQLQHLLWTIRPLICLPDYSPELIRKLGIVVKASDADIMSNITRISKSCYSNEELFSNFSNEIIPTNPNCCNLVIVMKKNFQHLSDDSDYSSLASVPCIPVHVDLNQKDSFKMALVKPDHVIRRSQEAKTFHPYLHSLPAELYGVCNILQKIGYHENINVHHMQMTLEKIYSISTTKELNPNARKIVYSAICKLKYLLSAHEDQNCGETIVKDLTPLFLPDSNYQMRPSTTMLYGDTSHYYGRLKFELGNTPYSYFNLKVSEYRFFTKDFCNILPSAVRPVGLSIKCTKVPNKTCKTIPSSDLANALETSFRDGANPENLTLIISKFAGEQKQETEIQRQIRHICDSLSFTTVDSLKAQIIFKESGIPIGELDMEYIYDESKYHIYLDSGADGNIDLVSEVTEHILNCVAPNINSPLKTLEHKNISKTICRFLKSNPIKKLKILDDLQISGTIGSNSHFAQLNKLGAEIPPILYNRLDQHHNNIYKPTEIVGYEISEDKIIVAQVAYLIDPESMCGMLNRMYKIYVKENDEFGIEVSILQLYKFIDGSKPRSSSSAGTHDGSSAVIFYDGDHLPTQNRTAKEKKRQICEQLREIWRLPNELKRKAIKRLYLFYHPDKNLDKTDEFELLFMFLKDQIVHLENNEELDDPELDIQTQKTHPVSSTRPSWSRDFKKWDNTARMQHMYTQTFTQGNGPNESPFFHPFSYTSEDIDKRNPTEGHRWVKQAEIDMRVLRSCLEQAQDTNGYAHVCFLSHQVVEKALKGGVYALCGVDARNIYTHELTGNAHALRTIKPKEAANLHRHSFPLEGYYTKTRYPDEWGGHTDVPSDHFFQDDAESACEHAGEVLRIVKSIMPEVIDAWT